MTATALWEIRLRSIVEVEIYAICSKILKNTPHFPRMIRVLYAIFLTH